MSRKGSSGIKPVTYFSYDTAVESKDALGYGNGGITDQWMAGLSKGEKTAARWYTESNYKPFNKALRDGDPLSKSQSKHDANLQSAINKYTLDKPTIFYRGSSTSFLGGVQTVDEINAMKGQIISDKAYLSTSASKDAMFKKGCRYRIHTPPGKGIGAYITGLSQHPHENEFVFNKGSSFKIMGAHEIGKWPFTTTIVDLEYVGHS